LSILIVFEKWLERVEGFFLAASLIALLVLTLYAVAYRNLAAPFVLKMQSEALDQAAKAEGPDAAVGSAPGFAGQDRPGHDRQALSEDTGQAPSGGPSERPGTEVESGNAFMGDLGDDEPAPAQPAKAANAYMGDLGDDEPAPAQPAKAANAYMGDLADDVPPPPAKNAYMGDLADEEPPPAGAAGGPDVAPAAQDRPGPDRQAESGVADVPSSASDADVPSGMVAAAELPPEPEEPPLLRTLKALNFGWIDVITRHLLLWVAFFGAAIAASKRKHIKIDALSRLIPEAWRARLLVLLDVLSVVVCVFLARAAYHFMQSESEGSGMLYGPIPGWVGIVIIPVGFGLLSWHFVFEAVCGIASALGYRSPDLDSRRAEQQAGGEA